MRTEMSSIEPLENIEAPSMGPLGRSAKYKAEETIFGKF